MKHLSSLFLIPLLLTPFSLNAKTLTPEEAWARLEPSKSNLTTRSAENTIRLRYTLTDTNGLPSLYVFDREKENGFMILSADNTAYALLGYSDKNNFDPDNVPPQLAYWLNVYSDQISESRKSGREPYEASSVVVNGEMAAISPLLSSKWNHGSPYNTYCFTMASDGKETQSVTGCVATSMAQVMYYFKYPDIGHGEISYSHKDSGTYSMNFGSEVFAWDEMLPTYTPHSYTEKQADAVAYLMKACGYSVRMDYGKGESGASGTAIAGALIDYFGYNKYISVKTRDFYTYDEWVGMIYSNLKNVGPVVYNGSALDGGHSFVCDGYDGNGYFHINWGWGGMSDGYYLLDALNPDEFGIGGAAGGFNLGQQVILNISPESEETVTPSLMQYGNLTGKITDNTLKIEIVDTDYPGLQYDDPNPVQVTLGVKIVNYSDPSQNPQYFESAKKNVDAKQGSYFKWSEYGPSIPLDKVIMTEGNTYNFIISTLITQDDSQIWSDAIAMPGKYNYVSVVKVGDSYKLETFPSDNITVSDFKVLTTPICFNSPVKFSATFSNASSSQLTRNFSAVFFNSEGSECYKMENYSVNINPGETENISWTSVDWYQKDKDLQLTEAKDFTMKLYDNWQGEYVEGIESTVTIYPERTEKTRVESELTILNGTKEGEVFVISGDELEVSLHVKVLEGVFNHTIMLALQAPQENGDYYTIMHKHFDAIPYLTAGEEATYQMSVELDGVEKGKTYRVEVWGPDNGFNEKVLVRFNTEDTGIDTLPENFFGEIRIYSVDGRFLGNGYNADIIKNLPKGIYIINGKKIAL